MIFSPGNFITLLIVLFSFILLRWLDRRNRNLARAREYGEQFKTKIKEELSDYAASLRRDIKDYGLDLGVHTNAAKALKSNIDAGLTALREREQQIESINEHLQNYTALLKELDSQSARVQENLLRVEQESAFVDDVNLKINVVKKNIQNLEGSIAAMRERIENNVSDTVEKAAASIEKNAAAILEPVRYSVNELEISAKMAERQVAEHREIIEKNIQEQCAKIEKAGAEHEEKAASGMRAITALLNNVAEKARERSGIIENDIYQKIVHETEEHASSVKKELSRKIDDMLSESNVKILDISKYIQDETEKLRAESNNKIASLSDYIENETNTLQSTAENLHDGQEELKRRWDTQMNALNELLSNEAAQLNGEKERIENEIARLAEGSSGKIDSIIGNIDAKISMFEKMTGEKLAALNRELEEQTGSIEHGMDEKFTALNRELEEQTGGIERGIDEKFTALNRELEEQAGNIEDGIDEKLTALSHELEEQAGSIERGITEKLAVLTAELQAKTDSLKSEFENTAAACAKDTAEKIDAWAKLRDETALAFETLCGDTREETLALTGSLKQELTKIDTESHAEILALENMLTS
ncbi:MAG: hypothetical protein LBG74_07100, partial [Spirochaetaceae bacterium]|nr:hypothetical protein [Spirochaetaceae bacterium]